jgi:RimJ/RimL family protein N-acetyltransferase
MRYESKTVTLKNGESCLLRSPTPEDAESLLLYLRQTSDETRNMVRYGDEITMTVDEEAAYLRDSENNPAACMVSAWVDGELAGNAGINPVGSLARLRHRATFGIAIKKKYWHMGIGAELIAACIEAARKIGYEQIELDVVAGNTRAAALYERFGFVRYGRRPNGMKFRDGTYTDEILMVLPLPGEA